MAESQDKLTAALATLENAVTRCMTEDVCTAEVVAALDSLASQSAVKWPFDQFRRSLLDQTKREWGFEKEARRQVMNASLNAIRRALQR